jgi:hypothetical protein
VAAAPLAAAQTGEAERVAVDHVARAVPSDASSSAAQRACAAQLAV